jgi:DNA topoisomerase III
VKNHEKLKYPPYPLNTIELQKRASRYFRMSSEHTMKVKDEIFNDMRYKTTPLQIKK